MKPKLLILLAVMTLALGLSGQAAAYTVCTGDAPVVIGGTDTASDGHPIAGTAAFSIDGAFLKIVLTNTLASPLTAQIQMLQGVAWNQLNDAAGATLNPTSGSAIAHKVVNSLAYNASNVNVGGEWAYQIGAPSPALGTADRQIYGSGTYGGGNPDATNPRFFDSGTNLGGPVNPDGAQYGIIPTTGPDNILGSTLTDGVDSNAVVKGFITFKLGLSSAFLNLATTGISDDYCYSFDSVSLFFGTSPGSVVPLPGALVLLGAGMVRLVAYSRRKKAVI